MIEKKFWMVNIIFTIAIALAMVGGNWDTSDAQTVKPNPGAAPPPAAPLISSIITAGIGHTCAITPADGLRCWGLNDSGQLGDATFTDSSNPVNVVDIIASGVIDLESGIKHTCVLTSNSEVYCWGLNNSGQLGDGTYSNRNVPVLVKGLEGNIVSISGGAEFTCAVSDTNDIMCWGDNTSGQLNDGSTLDRNVAVFVDPDLVNNVLMVSGGQKELQGVTTDGAYNFWNGEPIIPVTGLPEENNVILSADRFFEGGCSTSADGVVQCWGAIIDAEVQGGVLDYNLLDSGGGHACTVTDQGLVCWGDNSTGQLGNGSLNYHGTEAQVVKGIPSVVDLAAGLNHSCAIIDNKLIKCWGENTFGQLGNGTNDGNATPVDVL